MSDNTDPKRIGSAPETPRLGAHKDPELIPEHGIEASGIPEVEAEDPIIKASEKGVARPGVAMILVLAAIVVAGLLFFATNARREIDSEGDTTAFYMGPTAIRAPGSGTVDASRIAAIYASSPSAAAKAMSAAGVTTGTESEAAAMEQQSSTSSTSAAGTQSGTVVVYLFDYDSNNVPENEALTNLAADLTASGRDVAIVAYTDPRGSRDYNMRLSERRAKAVGDYLVAHGVDRSHVKCRGAGPTDSYPTARQDRRAEIRTL